MLAQRARSRRAGGRGAFDPMRDLRVHLLVVLDGPFQDQGAHPQSLAAIALKNGRSMREARALLAEAA